MQDHEHAPNPMIVIQLTPEGDYSAAWVGFSGSELHHAIDTLRAELARAEAMHRTEHDERGDWEKEHGPGVNGSEASVALGPSEG